MTVMIFLFSITDKLFFCSFLFYRNFATSNRLFLVLTKMVKLTLRKKHVDLYDNIISNLGIFINVECRTFSFRPKTL